jgi:serine protease Do
MRVTRLVGIAVLVSAVLALLVAVAPAARGQQRTMERRVQDAQNRALVVQPEIHVLTGGGPQIGVTIKEAAKGDGAEVTEVQSESPASRAGFRSGDIIVEFDGERVRSAAQLSRLVRETPVGRTVKVTVTRDGKRMELSVAPEERSGQLQERMRVLEDRLRSLPDRSGTFEYLAPDRGPLTVVPRGQAREPFNLSREPFNLFFWQGGSGRLGVMVENLPAQLAAYFGVKAGVLVTEVTEGSAAAKAGLKAGDVITAINDTAVKDGAELARLVRDVKDGGEITIGIIRDRKPQTLKAKLEDTSPSRRIVVRKGIPV